MDIAAYVGNLIFADKLQGAAKLRGDAVRPAQPAELADRRPDLVVVDLTEPGWESVADAARSLSVPVLAFGPHIRSELFAAAREHGVQRAVANSKFAESLPELLAEFA